MIDIDKLPWDEFDMLYDTAYLELIEDQEGRLKLIDEHMREIHSLFKRYQKEHKRLLKLREMEDKQGTTTPARLLPAERDEYHQDRWELLTKGMRGLEELAIQRMESISSRMRALRVGGYITEDPLKNFR